MTKQKWTTQIWIRLVKYSCSQHFRPQLNLDFDLGDFRGESAMPQIKTVRYRDTWCLVVSLHFTTNKK